VTDGAIVTAYQPLALAAVQQLDPIYVDVPQSTTELLRLQRRLADGRLTHDGTNQNAVQLTLEDGTTYPPEGALQFRDVSVDPTTGSVILRMVFPNPKGVLLPGMFVRALVKEGVNEQAVLIPQQSVSRDPKGNPLALIVDASGTAQPRMLTLDRAIGDKWLVTSGLAPGDRVIVEGLQRVRPGAPVKAVPFAAGGKENAPPGNTSRPAPKSN
jgi:membrane fusion protein (multidrug efflux system)